MVNELPGIYLSFNHLKGKIMGNQAKKKNYPAYKSKKGYEKNYFLCKSCSNRMEFKGRPKEKGKANIYFCGECTRYYYVSDFGIFSF